VALRVACGVTIAPPVKLQFFSAGNVRVLVVLEDGASLILMETNAGDAGSVRNIGTEIVLGENARLFHVRLAASAPKSVEVEHISAFLARGAQYRGHITSFGAKLGRTELHIGLRGEGSQAHLSGVNVLGGETHADITTHIDHAVGHTHSTQLFKNVAGGKSHAVYQGRITVRQGANGSDSRQTAKALLMGTHAEADLKPELEILADDVKCAHGAAVGDLDRDSLFYLRSRGIPDREARDLLVRAFLEEAVAEIEDESIRAAVWHDIEKALPHAMEPHP
jgi:Fe-S cluster assembly protein SufD